MKKFLSASVSDLRFLSTSNGSSKAKQTRKASLGQTVSDAFRTVIVKNPPMPCRVETPNSLTDFSVLQLRLTNFIGPKKYVKIRFLSNLTSYLQIFFNIIDNWTTINSERVSETHCEGASRYLPRRCPLQPNTHQIIQVKKKDEWLNVMIDGVCIAQLRTQFGLSTIDAIEVDGDVIVDEISTVQTQRRYSRQLIRDLVK
ncbi:unnamed protein product, partial [Mesorhabditis belari]|uniref:Uncharacterized protein n=1 Tax=Mesorhabditis belari TaxID=2138241 RepID=A0AAF3FHD5_9BILA